MMPYSIPSSRFSIAGSQTRSRPLHWQLPTGNWQLSRAYTLTEVLVVIAVIVLLLATSVPVFKALTGNRSVDAAANVVGGALGEARAEAIALQKVTGLFFFQDRISGRVNAALVRSTGQATENNFNFHLLNLVPERDFFVFPPGVGIQFIDNCDVDRTNAVSPRADDGYIGLNTTTLIPVASGSQPLRYGGVILFDPRGQLISLPYAFDLRTFDNAGQPRESDMCLLFSDDPATNNVADRNPPPNPDGWFIPPNNNPSNNFPPPQSQFGFVLYDAEPFRSIQFSPDDPQLSGRQYDNGEQTEERWLDDNGVPFLVNRYNGTLIRGE